MINVLDCVSSFLRAKLYGPRVPDKAPGASEELVSTARDLRHSLQPYLNHPDPLAALMTDLFNKRQLSLRKDRLNGGH
jgi:hypothetical protein